MTAAGIPTPPGGVHPDLTPDGTFVRLSVARIILAASVLASIAGSGAIAWYALNSKVDSHAENRDVHLERDFVREHGIPVGKWDLAARDEQAARAFAALGDRVELLEKAAAEAKQAAQDRKPRWRP